MMNVHLDLTQASAGQMRAFAAFASALADLASGTAAPAPEMQPAPMSTAMHAYVHGGVCDDAPVGFGPLKQTVAVASAFDLEAVRAAADMEADLPTEEIHVEEVAEEPLKEKVVAWRLRGQAQQGKTRRNAAQIERDNEALSLCERAGVPVLLFDDYLAELGGDWIGALDAIRKMIPAPVELKPAASEAAKVEEAPQIRTNPEDRSTEAETPTASDIVDEMLNGVDIEEDAYEEPAAFALEDREYTHEDIRSALGDYVLKFGRPVAEANIHALIGASMISGVPNDQEAICGAVLRLRRAIESGVAV